MQFIKDNLFYSSLVATVIVVGGALVAMDFVSHATTDEKQAPTENMSQKIARLHSVPYVNTDRINARSDEVTQTEALLRHTAMNTVRWSRGDARRRYTPMVLPKHKGAKMIGTIPAFPVDRATYKEFGLPYYARDEYGKQIRVIFKDLHPASPPTDAEITAELERLNKIEEENERLRKLKEEMLKRKAQAKDGNGETDGKTGKETGGEPPARGKALPPKEGEDGDEKQPPPEKIDYSADARNNMRIFKAGLEVKGKPEPPEVSIFANPDEALEQIFAAPDPKASLTNIWEAQLHLWIVKDIVDAIAKTNELALTKPAGLSAGEPGKAGAAAAKPLPLRRTVPNSAIKHILAINVRRGYIFGTDEIESRAPGTPRPRAGKPRAKGKRPTFARPTSASETLTGRVTCQRYEVKHYSLTVVMNVRYLPDLQKALLTHNQHTILNVTMADVDVSDNNRHFYGAGAVMKVTIEGEWLTLSEWTRGRWLPAPENKWAKGYERLMPVEVIKTIHTQDHAAQRPGFTEEPDDGKASQAAR